MKQRIAEIIRQSIDLKESLLKDNDIVLTIENTVSKIVMCYNSGGKVLFCGNGGSAADAQHLAAELSGRFYFDREPLFAEALHVNTSYLTAVANDYGYNEAFARLVRGAGKAGDVLVGLTTSGNSENILKAFDAAKQRGMTTIGMTGAGGGKLAPKCDLLLAVPSTDTPRIQEVHIMLGHIICELVESALFKH